MTIHYNIYPHRSGMCEHLVWFYFGDCEPEDMINLVPYMTTRIDKSIGKIFYCDWSWESEQGTVRMRGAVGVPQETLCEVCDKVIADVRDILAIDPGTLTTRR